MGNKIGNTLMETGCLLMLIPILFLIILFGILFIVAIITAV